MEGWKAIYCAFFGFIFFKARGFLVHLVKRTSLLQTTQLVEWALWCDILSFVKRNTSPLLCKAFQDLIVLLCTTWRTGDLIFKKKEKYQLNLSKLDHSVIKLYISLSWHFAKWILSICKRIVQQQVNPSWIVLPLNDLYETKWNFPRHLLKDLQYTIGCCFSVWAGKYI